MKCPRCKGTGKLQLGIMFLRCWDEGIGTTLELCLFVDGDSDLPSRSEEEFMKRRISRSIGGITSAKFEMECEEDEASWVLEISFPNKQQNHASLLKVVSECLTVHLGFKVEK